MKQTDNVPFFPLKKRGQKKEDNDNTSTQKPIRENCSRVVYCVTCPNTSHVTKTTVAVSCQPESNALVHTGGKEERVSDSRVKAILQRTLEKRREVFRQHKREWTQSKAIISTWVNSLAQGTYVSYTEDGQKSYMRGGNCPEDKTNVRHVVKPKSHALLGFGRLVWYQTQLCLECNGPNTGVLHHVLLSPSSSFYGLQLLRFCGYRRNGVQQKWYHFIQPSSDILLLTS